MNLKESQDQEAANQERLERINTTRRKLAEAEAKHAEAQRDVDDAANRLRRPETENPPLHELNQHAGLGHQSTPGNAGVEIDGQSAAAVNVNASANANPHS